MLEDLSEREIEVLSQIAKGLSNSEIAAALHISAGTAKTHVSRLLSKLGRRDRAQLVVIAYETGIAAANQVHPHPAATARAD
ncbi:MAG: response regulator transcription factor [Solirubrobacteraceae bacterium]